MISTEPAVRTLAADLPRCVGRPVTLEGWLHRRRVLKAVTFLVLRDRSGLAQAVFTGPHETTARETTTLGAIPEETVVRITGTATANPQAPGGVEITEATVTVLSGPAAAPPFDLYRPTVAATLPTILDHAPVALRHPMLRAPHAISAASVAGFRATLDALGFTEIHTPKVVASATESGANVFGLDWFGTRAYLAQSPQFFKQAMVGVFERVYETGPVFRAEPHDTGRHLAQYTSLDAELGFITDHHDVMAVLREALVGMVEEVARRAGAECALLDVQLPKVPQRIPEIHFVEAQELLAEHTEQHPQGELDLAPAHERWLSAWAQRECGSEFLFVTGYPMAKRPFYTHPEPGWPEYSNSFDLLFGRFRYKHSIADQMLCHDPAKGRAGPRPVPGPRFSVRGGLSLAGRRAGCQDTHFVLTPRASSGNPSGGACGEGGTDPPDHHLPGGQRGELP